VCCVITLKCKIYNIVVPYVENTLYSTNKYSGVRWEHTLYIRIISSYGGDVYVNYLIDNGSSQLDAVLHSYNLAGIFKFPTRFGLNSHTAIDNVFTDTSTTGKYDSYPLINGLSDHDIQLLILNKGQKKQKECHTYIKRKINKYIIADFQLKLSHVTWELVFDENDVNKIFNSFLHIFLRIYYTSFPLIQAKNKMNQNSWITPGIITFCTHKRELL